MKKKKMTLSKQQLNPFIKVGMYIFLFVIIPALFIDLNIKFFTFKEAFMPGILFSLFWLSKGYIWASCLKLTNKYYLGVDIFFIIFFAGQYIMGGHSNNYLALLCFAIYAASFHCLFMFINILYEGFTPLKEKILAPEHIFQRRMMDFVDVVKPVVKYSRKQLTDNFKKKRKSNTNIDIELITKRFFNSIDRNELPLTSNEIIKIYKKLNINIFQQRRYNKSEFSSILITLNLVRSDSEYNSLKRQKCSLLKSYILGGNLKKLLHVIAILKEIDCPATCAKDIYDYWIATESSQS